ncbi:hypothetical protein [Komagataeibacter saccharivorans]|nr:hypothetical protein [Komagataeibacter saccharivorans]
MPRPGALAGAFFMGRPVAWRPVAGATRAVSSFRPEQDAELA